jgi:hypothetical protein
MFTNTRVHILYIRFTLLSLSVFSPIIIIRYGWMFSYTSYELFATYEVTSIAGRGRHKILGDDPTQPKRFNIYHVRRPTRIVEEFQLATGTTN